MGDGGQWHGGVVRFGDAEAFSREVDQFISKGALRVSGEAMPAPLEPFDFALEPPAGPAVKLRGMIVSTSGGLALVQILDFSQAIASALREITRPPVGAPRETIPPEIAFSDILPTGTPGARALAPPPAASGSTPPMGQGSGVGEADGFDQPVEYRTPPVTGVFAVQVAPLGDFDGVMENPQGLDGMAALPLGAVAAVADVRRTSAVGVLRYLGARRASGTLTVTGMPGQERRIGFDRGALLLSPQERQALLVVFQWPSGTYSFKPGSVERPAHRAPVSAWRLVIEAMKVLVREVPLEALAASLDLSRAPNLAAAFAERSRSLELAANEDRVIRRDFDGRRSLREIAKLGAISELNLLRVTCFLRMLGLVDLAAPQGVHEVHDEVREHYERTVPADLFAALGAHWSDPPAKIEAGLADVRQRYGPGSGAAASSPEYAAKLIELAERAHRRLKERAGRRAYRAELSVDVRHSAEMLVQQVPIAKARGEHKKAVELLSAACDLVDRPDWERILREMSSALAKPPV